MPAVNLNVVPELQKAKDVTFRLYAWGATTGAGTFALARLSGDDLVFTGFVSPNNVLAFEQLGKSGNEITLYCNYYRHTPPNIRVLERGGDSCISS
ncbi:MAG: hypothetical protein H6759_02690 [Candidatus Nomurabacteria bacterium]|nr:MAG: hypothetical protein H6759_02690 [Candidatus Nomurabacteria bacterium]